MNAINQNTTSTIEPDNNFDALSQGFDGEHFYGLEYILEDFFQNTTVKAAAPAQQSFDWFGLNT